MPDIFDIVAKEESDDIFNRVAVEEAKPDIFNKVAAKEAKPDIFDRVAAKQLTGYQEQVISGLRQEGLEDWKIKKLSKKMSQFPDVYQPPETQTEYARRVQEIELSNIRNIYKEDKPIIRPEELSAALKRGGRKGVILRALGSEQEETPETANFLERLTETGGKLLADSGFMIAGAKVGGAIGTAVSPGIGTAVGAGAGMFMLPTAIESIFDEYEEFAKKGTDLTFGEFIKRGGAVTKETAKAGVLGAMMGTVGKAIPYLSKIPGFKKLLDYKYGKATAKFAANMAGFTGVERAFEGELPSAQNMGDFALLMLAGESIGTGIEKLKAYGERPLELGKKKVRPIVEKIKKIVPEPIAEYIKKAQRSAGWTDTVKDILGERDVKKIETHEKWKKSHADLVGEHGKEFTAKEHQDMFAYANKTGNPFIEGDTFKDVKARTPKYTKDFIDKTVRKTLQEIRKNVNEDPLMKDITPRSGLAERYLPGFYEGDPKELAKVHKKVVNKLNIKNPHASAKAFLTYHEALKEGGLKPRYKTIPELMERYENNIARAKLNVNIIDTARKYNDVTGHKLISVKEKNPRAYHEAKVNDYIPFWDETLRTYKDKNGNIKVSPKPALIDPGFGDAFQGIFSKDVPANPNIMGKLLGKVGTGYDYLNRRWNRFLVSFSPYHTKTQLFNVLGQLGFKEAVNVKNIMLKGAEYLENPEYRKKYARARLNVGTLESLDISKDAKLFDKALDTVLNPEGKSSKVIKAAQKSLSSKANYLHEKMIPRIKAYSFEEVMKAETAKWEKAEGKKLTSNETKAMQRVVAEQMNAVFGGPDWESSMFFKDPKARKWMRRFVAFPGWTVSNLHQAFNVLKPGLPGVIGRRFMLRFIINGGALAGTLRGLFGGTQQKEDGSLYFDPVKALESLRDISNPQDYFSFTLPAIDYKTDSGKIIRFGRNSDGTRIKLTMGKQILEVPKYVSGITQAAEILFNKMSAPLREFAKQAFGHTPSSSQKTLMYPVRAKYEGGERLPWKGKKGLIAQLPERAKSVGESVTPFGVGTLIQDGALKWAQTLFGTFGSVKEATLGKEADNIRSALENKSVSAREGALEKIEKKLKRNDFTEKEINGKISQIKGFVKKDKYADRVRGVLMLADVAKRRKHVIKLKREMEKDNLEFTDRAIDGLFESELKSLAFEGFITKSQMEDWLPGGKRKKRATRKRRKRR